MLVRLHEGVYSLGLESHFAELLNPAADDRVRFAHARRLLHQLGC